LQGFGSQFGSEIDQIVNRGTLPIVSRRLAGEWLCGTRFFAWHRRLFDGALVDRPDGFAGHAIEHVQECLLGRLGDDFNGTAVDRDVGKDGSAGNIHVPNAVMNELIMPLSFTRTKIDRGQTLAEE